LSGQPLGVIYRRIYWGGQADLLILAASYSNTQIFNYLMSSARDTLPENFDMTNIYSFDVTGEIVIAWKI
jgi:hypothetical protein